MPFNSPLPMTVPKIVLEELSPTDRDTAGMPVVAGYAETPFAKALLGECPRGVCYLAFVEPGGEDAAWAEMETEWNQAALTRDDAAAAALALRIFPTPASDGTRGSVRVVLRGTPFQIRVWKALAETRPGQLISYSSLAKALGVPAAVRAVGSAVARNSVAWLIPCHRVIRKSGVTGEFRWGAPRKKAIITWEKGAVRPSAGATLPAA